MLMTVLSVSMPLLSRRALFGLGSATIGLVLAGCVTNPFSDREIAEFVGFLVDHAPADTVVIDAADERIAAVTVIQELFEMARDSDSEQRRTAWKYADELVTYTGPDDEMRAAEAVLDGLPHFDWTDDYPTERIFKMVTC